MCECHSHEAQLTLIRLQTISLLLTDHVKGGDKKCTLVLAPTVAIMQWRNEIDKFTTGIKVSVLAFRGEAF